MAKIKIKDKLLMAIVLAFTFNFSTTIAQTNVISFTNTEGTFITNATAIKIAPNKLLYTTESGGGTIELVMLPKPIQDEFNYNATNAAAADASDKEKREAFYHPSISAVAGQPEVLDSAEADEITFSNKLQSELLHPPANPDTFEQFMLYDSDEQVQKLGIGTIQQKYDIANALFRKAEERDYQWLGKWSQLMDARLAATKNTNISPQQFVETVSSLEAQVTNADNQKDLFSHEMDRQEAIANVLGGEEP
jgi:hypothetical protein